MGREAGVPNKNKRALTVRLQAEYGEKFDVIMMMGKECKNLAEISEMNRDRLVEAIQHRADAEDGKDLSLDDMTQLDNLRSIECNAIIASTASSRATIDGCEKLAQWIEPKLKQVEVKLDADSTVSFNFDLGQKFPDNLADAVDAIKDA